MAVSSFLKTPYILWGISSVGVGGVGAVALSAGGVSDYAANILWGTSQENNLVAGLWTTDPLKTKCFNKFFGDDNNVSFSHATFFNIRVVTPEKPASRDWSEAPAGCTHMQFSRKGKEAFTLQVEATVRNDKVGLALFALGGNVQPSSIKENKLVPKEDNVLQYYLFFLENANGKGWSIKGGYSWQDLRLVGPGNRSDVWTINITPLHIKSPSGNINVHEGWKGIAAGSEYKESEWQHSTYTGRWEAKKGDSGKEVFEDIELWATGKGWAEILGRDPSKTFEEDWRAKTMSLSNFRYEYLDGQWHYRPTLSAKTLDNWYAPFRGEKGIWTEIQSK